MRAHKLDAFLAFYFNRNMLKTVLLYASINLVVHRAGFEPAIFTLVEMIVLRCLPTVLPNYAVALSANYSRQKLNFPDLNLKLLNRCFHFKFNGY